MPDTFETTDFRPGNARDICLPKKFNETEILWVLRLVYTMLRVQPASFGRVIDAAVEGVKDYAEKQRDTSSSLAYRLMSVLETVEPSESGSYLGFSAAEILEPMRPYFAGTEGFRGLCQKMGVECIASEK